MLRAWILLLTLIATLPPAVALAGPLPMPVVTREERDAARQRSRGNDGVIEFDLQAAIERRSPTAPQPKASVQRLPAGEGAGGRAGDPAKNFSGYYLISNPTIVHYPRHVKVLITWRRVDGQMVGGECSGTLIGPSHVITAGHCVYTHEPDGEGVDREPWAVQVKVAPGWNDGVNGPAGDAFATNIHTWTGWTDDEDYDHDIAVLTLNRPVGAIVGWRGVGASTNWSWFDSSNWETFTYPGTDYWEETDLTARFMYYQAGDYDYDSAPTYGMDRPGFRGTSGGGAIKDDAVWAIRSHMIAYINDVDTYDVAITPSKLNTIAAWMEDDFPAVSDLMPLDVRAAPQSAPAGSTLDSFNFIVYNRSTVPHTSGTPYTVYIGAGAVTTTSDTYVTDGYLPTEIAPGGFVRISVPQVVIPPQLSAGDYRLGVFLTNQDYNYGNNMTREQDTLPISITCAGQAVPQPVFPEDGHPCVGTDITLDWAEVPGAGVSYQIALNKSIPSVAGPFTSTTIGQHTFYDLDPDSWYYWRVRAVTTCGGPGNWSPIFKFRTKGSLSDVSLLTPEQYSQCLGSSVLLTWDPVETASLYRVRLQVPATGGLQIFDAPGPSLQLTGLAPNTKYLWSVRWRNACLEWSSYGGRYDFSTAATSPLAAVPLQPIGGALTGQNPEFRVQFEPAASEYVYELQTAAGAPVATWQGPWLTTQSGLGDGGYRWRAYAVTCVGNGTLVTGAWSAWQSFSVDGTPPIFLYPPDPIAPQPGIWTNNPQVSLQWMPASDQSGVAAYWLALDQNPESVPDGTLSVPNAGSWSGTALEGSNWFHLVAVDSVGNVSPAQHLGPFQIDLTPPTIPVMTSSVPSGGWTNANDLTVSWSAAVDSGAGVAGYSTAWSTSGAYQVDNTVDTTALSATLVAANQVTHFFYIKAIDQLGHATAQQRYQIGVDRTDPTLQLWEPNGGEVYPSGSSVGIDFMAWDNSSPASLRYEHAYSVNGGASWYEIVYCATPTQPGGGCSGVNGPGTPNNTWWDVPWVPPGSHVLYRVTAIDRAGNRGEIVSESWFTIEVATGVGDGPAPAVFALAPNSPNPFNPRTAIRFSLAHATDVQLAIYDPRGRLVRLLVDDNRQGPSQHAVLWDGTDDRGEPVPSGVYVYRLQAGGFTESRQMILLK